MFHTPKRFNWLIDFRKEKIHAFSKKIKIVQISDSLNTIFNKKKAERKNLSAVEFIL